MSSSKPGGRSLIGGVLPSVTPADDTEWRCRSRACLAVVGRAQLHVASARQLHGDGLAGRGHRNLQSFGPASHTGYGRTLMPAPWTRLPCQTSLALVPPTSSGARQHHLL